MKVNAKTKHFLITAFLSFCLSIITQAEINEIKIKGYSSETRILPLRSESASVNLEFRSQSTATGQPTGVNSASISPELANLVDQLTHADLPFSFSGYVDVYYLENLNKPQNGSNTGISGAARAFDQKENQFQLGLAQTRFGWNKNKVDAVIDLTFGPNADLGNYGNKSGPLGASSTALSLKQAFITFKPDQKNSFTAGQFGTHIGYEVIESYQNYNYSLSNLFNNGPFYHQGLKFTHCFGQSTAFMVGVVNNWDNLYDNNSFKTAIAQLSGGSANRLFLSLNYIGGSEQTTTDSLQLPLYHTKPTNPSFKQLLDFVGKIQISEKFCIAINAAVGALHTKKVADLGYKPLKTWGGACLYMNYRFTGTIGFGLRAEFFDNSEGVQYIGKTDVQSYTATFNIKLDNGLFLKPECRMDIYKKNYTGPGSAASEQFMDRSGVYSQNKQITVGAAVIYNF